MRRAVTVLPSRRSSCILVFASIKILTLDGREGAFGILQVYGDELGHDDLFVRRRHDQQGPTFREVEGESWRGF